MDQDAIRTYIGSLEGVDTQIAAEGDGSPEIAWGDTFFYYDPERKLEGAQKFPFATIVTKDYPGWDEASNLNREGVFRLNIGLSREAYERLFPTSAGADPTALDVLMPHPTYAANHFVCVLNPSAGTFQTQVTRLIEDAHQHAKRRYR